MKNIFLYHILALGVAALAFFYLKPSISQLQLKELAVTVPGKVSEVHVDHFYDADLKGQVNLSVNLATGVPVLFGSSELTSSHLQGLAHRYFNEVKKQKLFAFGHAGFQNFAIMTALAANRPLLKNARIAIVISPTWFEGKYAKGTSLASFFEFCPESYLYTILADTALDKQTKNHIAEFINANYEKMASPSSIHRVFAQKAGKLGVLNKPFVKANKKIAELNKQTDFNYTSQQIILKKLMDLPIKRMQVNCVSDNWDSLFAVSKTNFKALSNNNSYGIENAYYSQWMSKGQKKELGIVPISSNQELKDFEMLLHFLKENKVEPVFIISPLNTLAHTNLPDLAPTVDAIKQRLDKGQYNYLDMFTPNLKNYEIGVLEDVMHPYDYGWYIMDKFISENLYCKKND